MAATKAQVNWTAVSFGTTAITRVTDVKFNEGGNLIDFSGDADLFTTILAVGVNKPSATVTTADEATIMGIGVGTTGSLIATHKDATGGASGGVAFVLANGVVENADGGGAHAAFSSGTLSVKAFSSDGSTNPLSFTRV